MAAWGGELKTPRFQTSVSDGGHGNRLVGALADLRHRLLPVHRRLQTVILERLPWEECIARYDRSYAEKGVVMYLDPPYPDNNVNYPHNMRSLEEHKRLTEVLKGLRARFLLTSYATAEVRELYEQTGFAITSVDFAAGMPNTTSNTKRHRNREIIVTNYAPPPLKQRSDGQQSEAFQPVLDSGKDSEI